MARRNRGAVGGLNRLRIIGGRWRGRSLEFPDVAGLRPTPGRVRETLFNWLAPVIDGARCLDLFAGSGALGIEALSRGAAEVVFVEKSPAAARRLRDNLVVLGIESPQVYQEDAVNWLQSRDPEGFEIVLLDPPFGQALTEIPCSLLEQRGWLAPGARIYLEAERSESAPKLPATWDLTRHKVAGQVAYRLAVRSESVVSVPSR